MITAEYLKALFFSLDELAARIREGHPMRPEGDSAIVVDAAAVLRLWQTSLVELSTKVHYHAGTDTGEAGTRRVQGIAARALRGEKP